MIIINAQTKKQREKLIGRELKDILWLQTMDTWESEVFDFFFFFFLLIGLIGIEALLPTTWFFPRSTWVEVGQWLRFLLLRKTEKRIEFFKGEGELERKRLCVCSSGGWSMAREQTNAGNSMTYDYKLCSLFLCIVSLCFHCILAG